MAQTNTRDIGGHHGEGARSRRRDIRRGERNGARA
jgi:hypothetical protein